MKFISFGLLYLVIGLLMQSSFADDIQTEATSPYSNTVYATPQDLEFYINPITCLPKYFYCKSTLRPENPDVDCLAFGQCEHLRTLEALAQSPYVLNILTKNPELHKDITKILNLYGKKNLARMIINYEDYNIKFLLKNLVAALSFDKGVLENIGVQKTPDGSYK